MGLSIATAPRPPSARDITRAPSCGWNRSRTMERPPVTAAAVAAPCTARAAISQWMVGAHTLHRLAVDLGLPDMLRLGEGEARSGGQNRPSILADALEAVVGAVYLDAGFDKADQLVRRLFKDVEVNPQMQAIGKDPKTQLQEWLQGRRMGLPLYRVVSTLGAAHLQSFDVECEIVELGRAERGIGGSRRAGEQAAAAAMLLFVKTLPA